MAKRPKARRSVLPDWLSGFSEDEGSEATGIPIKFIRLLFCDNAGLRRCRVVPISRLSTIDKHGVGIIQSIMGLNVWGDEFPPDCGLTATGEARLIPDLDTRVVCMWHPSHEMAISDFHEAPGKAWACCPRSALRRVLAAAEEKHGLTFRLGQEVEFYLLRPGLMEDASRRGLPEPVDTSVYCQTGAFDNVAAVMDDMVDCLDSFGIAVEQLHAESGPGQFELSPASATGLPAADNMLLVREAISAIAARHGLTATFLPKPFPQCVGSGAHMHISMSAKGENLMSRLLTGLHTDEGSLAESFLAGVLEHLPALHVFTASSPLSYGRIAPGTWSGAFKAWGINNRETPLRLCPGMEASSANVEVKSVDNTSNPYIAVNAVITAGLQGMEAMSRLPPECCDDPVNNSAMERLPTSLHEAIAAFEADDKFRQAMAASLGDQLLHAYIAVRRFEATKADSMSLDDQILQLYQRY